jgi:hypothetical protein
MAFTVLRLSKEGTVSMEQIRISILTLSLAIVSSVFRSPQYSDKGFGGIAPLETF